MGRPLPHHVVDLRYKLHSLIKFTVAARLITTHQAKIARVFETSDHGAQPAETVPLVRRPDALSKARHRRKHVDGGIAPLIRHLPVENDVSVEGAADRV